MRLFPFAAALALAATLEAGEIAYCPTGTAIEADGTVAPGEWADAASISIVVRADWIIEVRQKHDASHLYFLFRDVTHGEERLFPEVFIDPINTRGKRWEPAQWWFHVSHNLCEGAGQPNLYRKDGVFLCSHERDGWKANNPPAKDTHIVEISIDWAKLGIKATTTRIGLALAVTDATGGPTQKWFFWPRRARFDQPDTWGEATLH